MDIKVPPVTCASCGAQAPLIIKQVRPLPEGAPREGIVAEGADGSLWRVNGARPPGWAGESGALPTTGTCPDCRAGIAPRAPALAAPTEPPPPKVVVQAGPIIVGQPKVQATPKIIRNPGIAPAPLSAPYASTPALPIVNGTFESPTAPKSAVAVSSIPQRAAPTSIAVAPTNPTVKPGSDAIGAAAVEPTPQRAEVRGTSAVAVAATESRPPPSTSRVAPSINLPASTSATVAPTLAAPAHAPARVSAAPNKPHAVQVSVGAPVYSAPAGGNNRVQAAPPAPSANVRPALLVTRSAMPGGAVKVEATPHSAAPAPIVSQQAVPAAKPGAAPIPQQPVVPTVEATKTAPPVIESALAVKPIPALPSAAPTKIS